MIDERGEGYIFATSHHGEYGWIVSILNADNAHVRGYTRSRRQSLGDFVRYRRRARLPEHLGTLSLEILRSISPRVLFHRGRSLAEESALNLLQGTFQHHAQGHAPVYTRTDVLMDSLARGDDAQWMGNYTRLEFALLREWGCGMRLDRCGATGTKEDLCYISPRSANAICREAGRPYAQKLFWLPRFLVEPGRKASALDCLQCMAVVDHFSTKLDLPAAEQWGKGGARRELRRWFEKRLPDGLVHTAFAVGREDDLK